MNDAEEQHMLCLHKQGKKLLWMGDIRNPCKIVKGIQTHPDESGLVAMFHDGHYAALDPCDLIEFMVISPIEVPAAS